MSKKIIESSLDELLARRDLRDANSSTDELPAQQIELIGPPKVDDELDLKVFKRRPYLSGTERKISAQLPVSALMRYFKPGEFVHVPMAREEEIIINLFIKFNSRKLGNYDEFPEEDIRALTEMLPGRRIEDVQNYIEDYKSGSSESSILVYNGLEEDCEAGHECAHIALIASNNKADDWFKNLEKQFAVFESSGSITQIACRNGARYRNQSGGRIMIGACATQEERYNRVGELLMVYKGNIKSRTSIDYPKAKKQPSTSYKALILDGHCSSKSSPHGQIKMRQTVTCVVYDPQNDFFYSGGYDGNVLAWNASTGELLKSVGGHAKPINAIACHSRNNIAVYGTQSGGLYTFTTGDRGYYENQLLYRSDPVFVKPRAKDAFSNTVDHVGIPSHGAKMDVCYAGIGHLQSCSAGIVEAWDLARQQLICSSERLPDGLTCMNISLCGVMLAAGTGGISSDECKGDGIVRVLSLSQDLKPVLGIKTNKYDLDCVSFGPDNTLLFIGETSDCSVAVYDLRFPNQPIFSYSHGNENSDALVAHSWLSKGRVLATGGHDGTVKLWNCSRGFSLLSSFEFNSGISCISYSDIDHSLWIGTDNGGVYMLGSPGSLDDGHPSILSGKYGMVE